MGKEKLTVAFLALKAEGLPPVISTTELEKRLDRELGAQGYRPEERPSHRTFLRYLGHLRTLIQDAAGTHCHSKLDPADGISGADDLEHEGEDGMEAEPRQLEEITQAVRQYLVWVSHDTPIDVALNPIYLRRFASMNLRPGDGLEWRSVDTTWIARGLVASVVKQPPTVTYKLMLAPTFLMGDADYSAAHILDQINALEREHQLGKVSAPEYEERLRILQALRDDGGAIRRTWCAGGLPELGRAHEAGLLSRPQHN